MKKLELAFPVAQHVRLEIRQRADVANGKELLHWFLRFHWSTSARNSLDMSAAIALRAGCPSNSTRFTVSTMGISTPSRAASSRALCAVTTPSATVSLSLRTSSRVLPFPISTPTALFLLSEPVHV